MNPSDRPARQNPNVGVNGPAVGMKLCQNPTCGRVIERPAYGCSAKVWAARRYCLKTCFDNHLRDKQIARAGLNRRDNPLPERLTIPDSARRVATWDGVPQACPHCGGLWRKITGGVGCLTCGRDLYCSSALPG